MTSDYEYVHRTLDLEMKVGLRREVERIFDSVRDYSGLSAWEVRFLESIWRDNRRAAH